MINIMNLDLKDRKILYELDLDSRQSYQELGKKVGLSKEVVNYRISKMIDEKIIRSFYTRIDSGKLGLLSFRTFLRLQDLTPEKKDEIVNYIFSHNRVGWGVLVDGNWDINFMYWADTIEEFSNFYKTFLAKFGSSLEKKWISIYNGFIEFPKTFLLHKTRNERISGYNYYFGREKIVTPKEIKILSLLSSNSRIKTIDIAKEIDLTPKAVAYKIKELEKKKVIIGYGVNLSLDKLGIQYYKLHLNFKDYDPKKIDQILEFCRRDSRIMYVNDFTGGSDMEIDIYVKNNIEYHEILDEIRYKFAKLIKNFETLQYYKEVKYNLFPREIN